MCPGTRPPGGHRGRAFPSNLRPPHPGAVALFPGRGCRGGRYPRDSPGPAAPAAPVGAARAAGPNRPCLSPPRIPALEGCCTMDTATEGHVTAILVRPAGAQFPILSVFDVAARQEPRQPRPVSRVGKVPLNLIPGVQQDRLGEDSALVGGH